MSVFNRSMAIKQLRSGLGILSIPEGITELSEDFAFVFDWIPEKKCQCSFREIRIPSTVQTINGIVLTGYGPDEVPIKRFKKITVAENNPYFKDVDGVLFSKDMTQLICYPCGKSGSSYTIPDGVETIGERAFMDNVNLQKVVLPASIKRIECQAFFQCEQLSDINLPYGIEYIGRECFGLSPYINRLIIPFSVKKLYTSTFAVGSIISISHKDIELEYDYVPTEYVNMPFCGPAIISNNNDELLDFAESYDYNHFEGCYEDSSGIIWSDHGETLVCFPPEWNSDEYKLPEKVKKVYRNAFIGTTLKRFYALHKVTIVGKTEAKYTEPVVGKTFHLKFNGTSIFCEDKENSRKTIEVNKTDAAEAILETSIREHHKGYVFISYSSKNQQMADSVRLLLKENQIPCWMAPYNIPAGSRYAYVINDALENCSCFLLLLTKESQISQFVERETERAITYNKPIIPMQLEELELNSGFKFYIGNSQIIAVPEIRADAPEMLRILSGIKEFIHCDDKNSLD